MAKRGESQHRQRRSVECAGWPIVRHGCPDGNDRERGRIFENRGCLPEIQRRRPRITSERAYWRAIFTARYQEAQAQFERFVREYPNSPFRPQALLGIAASLDAQGKADQAITAYKELTSRYQSESIVTQAKFNLACLYEGQQKLELARDLFAEVEREDRMGSYGVDAGMRLEALFSKNPKLAPSTQGPGKATLQLDGK